MNVYRKAVVWAPKTFDNQSPHWNMGAVLDRLTINRDDMDELRNWAQANGRNALIPLNPAAPLDEMQRRRDAARVLQLLILNPNPADQAFLDEIAIYRKVGGHFSLGTVQWGRSVNPGTWPQYPSLDFPTIDFASLKQNDFPVLRHELGQDHTTRP